MEDKPVEVVGDIGQDEFRLGPYDADGSAINAPVHAHPHTGLLKPHRRQTFFEASNLRVAGDKPGSSLIGFTD